MRLRSTLAALFFVPLLVACADKSPSSDARDDSDLIGGRQAAAGELDSTMLIRGNCTVSKVGPRHILTAAHCVTGWASGIFAPGAAIQITTAKGVGSFEADAGPSGETWRTVFVDRVEVQPAWVAKCNAMTCGSVHVAGRNDMSDVAVIITRDELTGIPEAAVDLSPVLPGDALVVTGYGCEGAVGGFWDYTNQRLKVAETDALPFDAVIHPGSFVFAEDRAAGLASTMDGLYVITAGPAQSVVTSPDAGAVDAGTRTPLGGLCPGDSGGPLYRRGATRPTVVGVNANYTFAPNGTAHPLGDGTSRSFSYGGSPVTNWHTRLDSEGGQKVGAWLRTLGVWTTCSRGGCL